MRLSTRQLVQGGLLAALSLLIPLYFGFLRVSLPPFTATLASHVPTMLAMWIEPVVGGLVGLASAIGFFVATTPVVGARAAIHILWGIAGGLLVKRGLPGWAVLLLILPIHAIGEALVVVPFGFDLYQAGVVVGVGTVLHHLVDSGITLALLPVLGYSAVRGRAVQRG